MRIGATAVLAVCVGSCGGGEPDHGGRDGADGGLLADSGVVGEAGAGDGSSDDGAAAHADAGTDAASTDAGALDAGSTGCSGSDCAEQISAGWTHTCAVRASGTVICWGANLYGQLGDGSRAHSSCAVPSGGTTDCSPTPIVVSGVSDAVQVAAGAYFACALRSGGEVLCWGYNGHAELGDGMTHTFCSGVDCSFELVTVVELTDAVEIAAGAAHACARRASGEVVCWGDGSLGQLGTGGTSPAPTPAPVVDLADAVEIAAGGSHTCARRASGEVVCWGQNGHGELGDGITMHTSCRAPRGGSEDCSPTFVAVSMLDGATRASAGVAHTCARLGSGAVECWGANVAGQLGDGSLAHSTDCGSGWDCSFAPVAVVELRDAVEVAAGGDFSCALRAGGAVSCWGLDSVGALGDGDVIHSTCDASGMALDCSPTPVAVAGLDDAAEVAAGAAHVCARRRSGDVMCWGWNAYGQLGDATTTDHDAPVSVVLP